MSESEKERKSLGYSIQTFNDLDWDGEADFDIESKAFRKYTISLPCGGGECGGGGGGGGGGGNTDSDQELNCDSSKRPPETDPIPDGGN